MITARQCKLSKKTSLKPVKIFVDTHASLEETDACKLRVLWRYKNIKIYAVWMHSREILET